MAKTPEELAQLEPLWEKVIQFPEDISLEEKHEIMDWPPLEEMQSNTHKYLGLSVEDLIHKAASAPDSLTYPECRMIHDCFRILRSPGLYAVQDRWWFFRQRPELEAKKKQAEAAVLTPEELQAIRNLENVFREKERQHFDENDAKRNAEELRRPPGTPREWVEKIIDNKRYGYTLYRHRAMDGWEDFKTLLDGVLAMRFYALDGYDEIHDSKVAEVVEFELKDDSEEELENLRQ
jgi:hypothetical protein